ncbi:MAG TPA: DNA polymerase I [Bacteroidales bacterium]|nr:DNA polymerase I [Bacteroidales bacterium]HRT32881.1 DNA polymerase I [Bacteroidales bacterium]
MKKLYLIDGHALIFRSYYAFIRRPMINSKGVDTSILYGFTKTLLDLIIKEKPTHIAVAFDPPAKTFRHELYPEYKANRGETPEQVRGALEPLISILNAISIPVIMKPGFEADDVIGTIAKKAEREGFNVFMVTPDKDFGQLVSDNIVQFKPGKNGADMETIGKEKICSIYNIDKPEQVIDILTLQGDISDNVPGVRGIGEVGSKKLVQKYGSVENIYNKLDELPEKQQIALKEAKKHIELSKRLITIDTNVDIPWDEESLKLSTPNFEELKRLFSEYEFSSLMRLIPKLEEVFELTGKPEDKSCKPQTELKAINYTIASADKVRNEIFAKKELAIKLIKDRFIICCGELIQIVEETNIRQYKDILEDGSIVKCGYDLKSVMNKLFEYPIILKGYMADIELMHYLLMPERAHKVEIIVPTYLGVSLDDQSNVIQGDLFDVNISLNEHSEKDLKETAVFLPLYHKLADELQKMSLDSLYNDIEMPLISVLSRMETTGVKIDTEILKKFSEKLNSELTAIEEEIRRIAQDPTLNVSSPKQLGVLLYDKLRLGAKNGKNTKKNLSTDEETLLELENEHPVIPLILEFRNIKKLISTYADPLPQMISPKTGKIHTTFNQALTSTGRLSSVKPNLQNIPIRTERGKEIRKAFIPSYPEGYIMSSDYSQIELRLMAHMSGDDNFIEAFRAGKDIHSATASKIFDIPEDQLTKEQRSRAKVANFGIIYGISAFGLAQRLHISRGEAKKLIDEYFAKYPKVQAFINNTIEFAKKNGYVETLYGRKRFIPDINSKNPVVRGLAERNAVNAPIQGSAADIIKIAMIRVDKRIIMEGIQSRMILQVHDELVFDVVPSEKMLLTDLVKKEMESVALLSVPLTVDCKTGKNWLEAH